MSLLKRILSNRKVVFPLLALYFVLAAWVGGPWFALFTGGLVALAAGFMWWLSRDKSTQRLGSSVLLTGFAVASAGLWIGNTPTVLPDSALPYEPILAKPTAPLIPAILPVAGPESALPSPSAPSPSATSSLPLDSPTADDLNEGPVVVSRPAPTLRPPGTGGAIQPSRAVEDTESPGAPLPSQTAASPEMSWSPAPHTSGSPDPVPSVDPTPSVSDPGLTSPPSSEPEPTPEPTEGTSGPVLPTDLPTQADPPPADPDPVWNESAPWTPEPEPTLEPDAG